MGSLVSFLYAANYIPRLYFAAASAILSVKKTSNRKEIERISLQTVIDSRCPSLRKEFRPAWWLFSGHLQTLYCVMGDFSKIDKVEYERKLLRTMDGGTLGLDFTSPATAQALHEETPVVVVLHGLTGGSHESYVRAILAPACTPIEQGGLGYRGVVVNFRGCAGVPITSPQLYSAGHTDDIRVALMYISKLYPHAPLLGVGFSLGANVLTRYLAQEGERSRLSSGCVLACPWDLVANSKRLETGWIQRKAYSPGMASNLRRLVKRHAEALSAFPDTPISQALPVILSGSELSLAEFDSLATRHCGGSSPPFPFPSAYDYYAWASSHNLLADVRVPFLALNADDDPIVSELPIDSGNSGLSPWVVFGVTRGGGHLGWFEQDSRWGHAKKWVSRPVLEWLKTTGEDVVGLSRGRNTLREVDGYLMEEGRNDIGCKEVEGGGHVIGVEGEEGLLAGL